MRVRFLRGCVANNENYNAGDETDLGGSLAARMIAWGLAEKVEAAPAVEEEAEDEPPEADPPVAAARKRTR